MSDDIEDLISLARSFIRIIDGRGGPKTEEERANYELAKETLRKYAREDGENE